MSEGLAHAAHECFASYARYLARAAGRSARTLDCYQRVLECVSSGQLTPTTLADAFARFAQTRGGAHASSVVELEARLFAGLVQYGMATLCDREGDAQERLTPNAAAPWWEQLTRQATDLHAAVAGAYQERLERVANGQLTPAAAQLEMAAEIERRRPAQLRGLAQLCLEHLDGLLDLNARAEQAFLLGVLAATNGLDSDGPCELRMEGPLGATSTASLSLTNTRPQVTLIRCQVNAVRRADGIGPAFAPAVVVTPDPLEIAPEQSGSVQLTLSLDAAVYAPDALYVGALRVTPQDATPLEVPLSIMAASPR